jgi:hypothetical protein
MRDVNYEPGSVIDAHWVTFTAEGDSVEISARTDTGVPVFPMTVATSLGQEQDSLHNTTSSFRHRVTRTGIINTTIDVGPPSADTVPFILELARIGGSPASALAPTGDWASLRLISRTPAAQTPTSRFVLVPASVASSVTDLSAWEFSVHGLKVILVRDSLYQICPIPCTTHKLIKLTSGAHAVWSY